VPYGVRIECESVGNHIEFGNNGGYDSSWEGSVLVNKRSGSNPGVERVQLDTKPCVLRSMQDKEIDTRLNFTKIVIGANPDADRTIKVDIN
jgi:hypothetical protein